MHKNERDGKQPNTETHEYIKTETTQYISIDMQTRKDERTNKLLNDMKQ